jgi:serine/threonine protein kinase
MLSLFCIILNRPIARIQDSFYWRIFTKVCIVFDLLAKDVGSWLEETQAVLTPSQIQSIARQTLEAVAFLHKNHIVHLDIKPGTYHFIPQKKDIQLFVGNIMLEKDEYKNVSHPSSSTKPNQTKPNLT